MSDPTRGITCPDMRRVVREALHAGWVWGGFTGTTHAKMVWPKTGQHVSFGTTPSVASWKSLAKDIEKVSGVITHRKGNHKRSRKSFRPSGFSTWQAGREATEWHDKNDATVASLLARRKNLIAEARDYARRRSHLREIPPLLNDIHEIEEQLRMMAQPVVPFDPFSLANL